MIDPEAKEKLIKSRYPDNFDSPQEAINLLSTAYLNKVMSEVFELPDPHSFELDLARLSLASSILDNEEKNSFLVGESQNIIGMINDFPSPRSEVFLANLSDIAVKYHISNYDANAGIVAKKILDLLNSDNVEVSSHQREYFFNLANLLTKDHSSIRSPNINSVYSSTEEKKLFSFLSQIMQALIRFYDNGEIINQDLYKKVSNLLKISRKKEFPWIWAQEINHTVKLLSFAPKKALIPRLQTIGRLPKSYISGIKSRFIWPSTKEFLDKYFSQENQNAVINTPTGSGKTFLSELASASALSDGWVLYLAPTNALCSQISKVYKKDLSSIIRDDISVSFGYEEYTHLQFEKKKIFVTTPEKALIFLKLEPTAFQSCSLVTLDECHILGDRNRGTTAEVVLSLLIKINPNIRVILMSALVENNEELASWLNNVTQNKTVIISTQWKPTRIARFIVSLDESTKLPYKNFGNYSLNLAIHSDSESPWNSKSDFTLEWTTQIKLHSNSKGENFPFVNEAARELSEALVSSGKRTMVFVVRNRHHVFSIGDNWNQQPIQPFTQNNYESALINIAEFEFGTTSHVVELLKNKNIAIHSSSMLESEKSLTLSAFQRKDSSVITYIATGTLSQGMNLDFDTVVVAGTDRFDSSSNQRVEHEMLNAMGRAARANYAIHGMSFIIPTKPIFKRYSKSQLINKSTCIEKIDASTTITSDFKNTIDQFIGSNELTDSGRKLLALLPANLDTISSVLSNSWAKTSMVSVDEKEIINKLKQTQDDLVLTHNFPSWLLESASVTSVEPEEAVRLYKAIVLTNSHPPTDTYSSFTKYLIDILCTDSFNLFERLMKDHINIFMDEKYSSNDNRETAILSLKNTVNLWINGGDYLHISLANIQYKKVKSNEQWKRSSSLSHLPRVFKWIAQVAGYLSRYGGLLYAIKENWLKEQQDSLPSWLENSRVIGTFSLGIKNGVKSPEALACYESILSERLISNILSESTSIHLLNPDDIDERYSYSKKVQADFLLNSSNEIFTHPILRNLTYVINHAQDD